MSLHRRGSVMSSGEGLREYPMQLQAVVCSGDSLVCLEFFGDNVVVEQVLGINSEEDSR